MATKTKPAVVKSREATALRGKANLLRKELADENVVLTKEQVDAKIAEISALESRANIAAEVTPEDEIVRQGGIDNDDDDGAHENNDEQLERRVAAQVLSRFNNPDALAYLRGIRGAKSPLVRKVDEFTGRVIEEFGNVRAYLQVACGKFPVKNDKQRALMQSADELTRAIIGTTGDASGGEYLLPLTQVASIFSLSNIQPGIMQGARMYNVPGRSLRIPYLIQDDGDNTLNRPMAGKIANVTIIGEGVTKPARTPSFGQRLLAIQKWAAITQFGDETLADDFTGELPSEVTDAVGQQAINSVNEYCTIDGTGSGQPLGALHANNTALIAVNRATASSFTAPDAFAMYERHTLGPKSYWMISRRVLAKLFALQTTNNTMVTFIKNLTEKPQMLLLGLPVIVTDLLPTLGVKGDVALVNPEFYAVALRQALTVESSRDYAFVDDLTTYRFIIRAGGIPIPTGTYAYKFSGGAKVDEHSPFVVLDVPST